MSNFILDPEAIHFKSVTNDSEVVAEYFLSDICFLLNWEWWQYQVFLLLSHLPTTIWWLPNQVILILSVGQVWGMCGLGQGVTGSVVNVCGPVSMRPILRKCLSSSTAKNIEITTTPMNENTTMKRCICMIIRVPAKSGSEWKLPPGATYSHSLLHNYTLSNSL